MLQVHQALPHSLLCCASLTKLLELLYGIPTHQARLSPTRAADAVPNALPGGTRLLACCCTWAKGALHASNSW